MERWRQEYRLGGQAFLVMVVIAIVVLYVANFRPTLPPADEVTRTCSRDQAKKQSILFTHGWAEIPSDFGMHRLYTSDRSVMFLWYCDGHKPVLDGVRNGEKWFSKEALAHDKEMVATFERLLLTTWRTEN